MIRRHATVIALWMSVCAAIEAGAAEVKPLAAASDQETVFPLQEVSAFKYGTRENPNARYLLRGQAVQLSTEPDKQVKAYPQLKSKRPYYGKVTLGRNAAEPKPGVEYHYETPTCTSNSAGSGSVCRTTTIPTDGPATWTGPGSTPSNSAKTSRSCSTFPTSRKSCLPARLETRRSNRATR